MRMLVLIRRSDWAWVNAHDRRIYGVGAQTMRRWTSHSELRKHVRVSPHICTAVFAALKNRSSPFVNQHNMKGIYKRKINWWKNLIFKKKHINLRSASTSATGTQFNLCRGGARSLLHWRRHWLWRRGRWRRCFGISYIWHQNLVGTLSPIFIVRLGPGTFASKILCFHIRTKGRVLLASAKKLLMFSKCCRMRSRSNWIRAAT